MRVALEAQRNSGAFGGRHPSIDGSVRYVDASLQGLNIHFAGNPNPEEVAQFFAKQLQELQGRNPERAVAFANAVQLNFGPQFARSVYDQIDRDNQGLFAAPLTMPLPANAPAPEGITYTAAPATGTASPAITDADVRARVLAAADQQHTPTGTNLVIDAATPPATAALAIINAPNVTVGGRAIGSTAAAGLPDRLAALTSVIQSAPNKSELIAAIRGGDASTAPNLASIYAAASAADRTAFLTQMDGVAAGMPATTPEEVRARDALVQQITELRAYNPEAAERARLEAGSGTGTGTGHSGSTLTAAQLESIHFSDPAKQAEYARRVGMFNQMNNIPMVGPLINMFMNMLGMGPQSFITENAEGIDRVATDALAAIPEAVRNRIPQTVRDNATAPSTGAGTDTGAPGAGAGTGAPANGGPAQPAPIDAAAVLAETGRNVAAGTKTPAEMKTLLTGIAGISASSSDANVAEAARLTRKALEGLGFPANEIGSDAEMYALLNGNENLRNAVNRVFTTAGAAGPNQVTINGTATTAEEAEILRVARAQNAAPPATTPTTTTTTTAPGADLAASYNRALLTAEVTALNAAAATATVGTNTAALTAANTQLETLIQGATDITSANIGTVNTSVRAVETALAGLGFQVTPDGKLDARTLAALNDPEVRAMLASTFKQMDRNNDGHLTEAELGDVNAITTAAGRVKDAVNARTA
jgi:hypothetical protein